MSLTLVAQQSVGVEDVLRPILVQLAIIIVVARLFAAIFRRLGQPGVVGEIAAGLILGPSLLGYFFPELFAAVFHPVVSGLSPDEAGIVFRWSLTTLSEIGLILLLFLIGLEFDFNHLRWHGRAAVSISIAGIAAPFGLGVVLALLMWPSVSEVPKLGFVLFLGTALSITAIPILGRIMMEMNITRTKIGTVTISAAAVDDAAGWMLLAAVAAIVRAEFDVTQSVLMLLCTLGFGVGMVFVAGPLLRKGARALLRQGDGELGVTGLAVLLAAIFLSSLVTSLIGIFAIFGAFFLGAVLSSEVEFREAVGRRLRDFVTAFFLPIFFTYTGLRTDIGSLGSWQLWAWCGALSAAAILGKFGGCTLAARLSRFSLRESACIGAMMNTRALMALIVINVGKDLGVIPDTVFCMLVIMALLTTVMTTPMLLRFMRGTELEPYIVQSGFLNDSSPRDDEPPLAVPETPAVPSRPEPVQERPVQPRPYQ